MTIFLHPVAQCLPADACLLAYRRSRITVRYALQDAAYEVIGPDGRRPALCRDRQIKGVTSSMCLVFLVLFLLPHAVCVFSDSAKKFDSRPSFSLNRVPRTSVCGGGTCRGIKGFIVCSGSGSWLESDPHLMSYLISHLILGGVRFNCSLQWRQ
jgi:hypothetical protein